MGRGEEWRGEERRDEKGREGKRREEKRRYEKRRYEKRREEKRREERREEKKRTRGRSRSFSHGQGLPGQSPGIQGPVQGRVPWGHSPGSLQAAPPKLPVAA